MGLSVGPRRNQSHKLHNLKGLSTRHPRSEGADPRNIHAVKLEYLRAVTLKQMVDGQKAKAAGVAQVQDMRDTVAKRDRTPVSA